MTTAPTLYAALKACETEADVKSFISDLLTPDEVEKAEERWSIVYLFLKNSTMVQAEIRRLHKQEGHEASEYLYGRVYTTLTRHGDGWRHAFRRLNEK